ncbi:MAG: DoxX family protein [Candidatus Peregrinibacteria bacterium]|nr:DoxX family protein [Candidatus Peregrinibacteria bacterium]
MAFPRSSPQFRDVALLLLRVAIAIIFLYHGLQKRGFWEGAPEGMSSTLVTIFKFLSIAEPLAGVSLLLGLLTQVGAIGILCVMISAMYMKISGGNDFSKWELDFILFFAALSIAIQGAGKYSLDAVIGERQ